jgi:cyanophycin synthetase
LAPKLNHYKKNLLVLLPHTPIIRTLVDEAKKRSIPVYPVAKNSGIWLFGQGVAGVNYFEAANHNDSFTGMRLQRDKIHSNILVKKLGFPGVKHSLVKNLHEANEIALKFGYPVVVKPSSSGKGNGVSAFVIDSDDLSHAFIKASSFSSGSVIIEKHVKGNDHRLAVFGGKLTWVAARYPAKVTGDGHSSIRKLIEQENHKRKYDLQAYHNGLIQISLDEDLVRHLQKQQLTLDSKPSEMDVVTLSDVANISKGGTIEDLTDITHPDNVLMAETIARGFHMDSLGIDFMTPDIRISWRDTPCAVIEVNGTPGIFFDKRAGKILESKFPNGFNGRIPCFLLISMPDNLMEYICEMLFNNHKSIGFTNSSRTQLKGQSRCRNQDQIQTRINALISDPSCDAMVISVKAEDLIKNGLPLDWVDVSLTFETIPKNLEKLLFENSGQFINQVINIKEFKRTINDCLKNLK